MESVKESFFTKDRSFYKTLFRMMLIVSLQNIVSYSVNMVDNVMLGGYSQNALSGAATVNQIFFMVEQFALSIGNTLVAITAQYWGKKEIDPIRALTGIALKLGLIISACIVVICAFFPTQLLRLFTNSPDIIAEGKAYLMIVMWTFVLFIISNVLMAALRAVGTVNISFYISIVSLCINVCLNYVFIYGHFGMPEMGVRGAAIATLIARIAELCIILFYVAKVDKKLHLFQKGFLKFNRNLRADYKKVYIPIMYSQVFWGISVPMQTAILGHLSDDAIAANSVATTFYQYLKVIVLAMSATSAVMIGNAIGRGDMKRIKSDGRTLSVIDVIIGIILGLALIVLRNPLMSLYNLDDSATQLALKLIVLMGFIMMTMSYQMPVSFGIIQGGGDTKFTMKMNLISVWCIVMPLSFMAAFWWKLPVVLVVLIIQSDQVFKIFPTLHHFRKYTWMKKLTRDTAQ